MQPIATDGVNMDSSNYAINWESNLLMETGALLRGITSGFSCTPPGTILSGHDVTISPHAVDQGSDWPATEAFECHIKFFANDKSPTMQPLIKILLPLF